MSATRKEKRESERWRERYRPVASVGSSLAADLPVGSEFLPFRGKLFEVLSSFYSA